MSDDEVIVLRKYVSEVEATMAHLVLEAHNIPSAVMRDTAGGMIPSMAILYPVRLAVRREDADEARRILDSEAPLPGEDGAVQADVGQIRAQHQWLVGFTERAVVVSEQVLAEQRLQA